MSLRGEGPTRGLDIVERIRVAESGTFWEQIEMHLDAGFGHSIYTASLWNPTEESHPPRLPLPHTYHDILYHSCLCTSPLCPLSLLPPLKIFSLASSTWPTNLLVWLRSIAPIVSVDHLCPVERDLWSAAAHITPLPFIYTSIGDLIYIYVFGNPILVLNSATAASDLLEKRGGNYSSRPLRTMVVEL